MAPNAGLVHLKEYDIKDSNVEFIGSDIDHKVKYKSAATEPAWAGVGSSPTLLVWRIEDFEVVSWPKTKYGMFYDGDSYIILHSYPCGDDMLGHEIYFWLGDHTTQDEAGTAAYKTVELDEVLQGKATQRREVQRSPSKEFLALFPRITILSGGVRSGFRHVEEEPTQDMLTLSRIFQPDNVSTSGTIVYEVEPTWKSLDDGDVYVLNTGDKIWVWQGKDCSPKEKAKAAHIVHTMTQDKHAEVEVVAQGESGSGKVITLLGGNQDTPRRGFQQPRPVNSISKKLPSTSVEGRKLFRISDAAGELSFNLVKEGGQISQSDLDTNDVFLLDDSGQSVWVWEGRLASHAERSKWLQIARAYIQHLQSTQEDAYLIPLSKVPEGSEPPTFIEAMVA